METEFARSSRCSIPKQKTNDDYLNYVLYAHNGDLYIMSKIHDTSVTRT